MKEYLEAKQTKDKLQEHLDFLTNELKLVKDVNQAFRIENNRLMGQYTENAKELSELKVA